VTEGGQARLMPSRSAYVQWLTDPGRRKDGQERDGGGGFVKTRKGPFVAVSATSGCNPEESSSPGRRENRGKMCSPTCFIRRQLDI